MARRCHHNTKICIEGRVINKTPDADWSDVVMPQFMIDTAMKIKQDLVPFSFDEWVGRFPAKKRDRLYKEHDVDKLKFFNKQEWNVSKMHIKREFYASTNKKCRPIHSASVTLNYLVGRWLVPLSELFAEYLPENIYFPIHGDSEAIGEFDHAHASKSFFQIVTDYTSYDSTQREAALTIICEFFLLCGVPKFVVNLMFSDVEFILVKGPHGSSYKIKAVRLSGRSETLIGNTVLTVITCFNVFGRCLIAMMCKGDDGVTYLGKNFDPRDIQLYKDKFKKLGFIIKMEISNDFTREFCSSVFIPRFHTSVLIPKPGRFLAKTLWCKNTNYNSTQIEEQFAGILNGVKGTYLNFPILRALYKCDVYLKWKEARSIKSAYNEYANYPIEYDQDEVYGYLVGRYGIFPSDVDEMEEELVSVKIPHALQHWGFKKLIEVDWSAVEQTDLLEEDETPENYIDYMVVILNVFIEELVFYCFPWMRVLVGVVESVVYKNMYNIILHTLLLVVSRKMFPLALILHLYINLIVCRRLSLSAASYTAYSNMVKNRKRQTQKRKPRRNPPTRRDPSRVFANMVGDPCNGPLVQGFYSTSEGMLNKLKSTYTANSGSNSGYILWDPTFTSDNTVPGSFNAVVHYTNSPSTNPLNTTVNPFGSGSGASSSSLQVGAGGYCASTTVADARTVGACIRASYVGRMDASAGLIALVENIPVETVLGANSVTPISVDELFNLSTQINRFGVDTCEVKYRPNDYSHIFRSEREGCFDRAAGVVTTVTNEAERSGSRMMGFAFKNVTDLNDILFEFHQNIEWRPNVDTGFVITMPKQLKDAGHAQKVVKYLDDHAPGWTSNLSKKFASGASEIAKMAFTGMSTRAAAQYGERFLARRVLPYLAEASPLLLTL